MAAARTIGVEEELHVVDLETGRLAARAPELLRDLPAKSFSSELQRSTIEINSTPVTDLGELRTHLGDLRSRADRIAAVQGLGVIACGTPPSSAPDDFALTVLGRFSRMQQNYRFLVDDQLICGLQVHVSVPDRDTAVRVAQRVSADLPTLLAMSASSPYWHGRDTGYASFRTMVWQRWPTAGSFGRLAGAAEYDALIADLIGSGVISDEKMAYFDVRPSAHLPTVELRICDACPLLDDVVLIAGLFRALVDEACAADESGAPVVLAEEPLRRAGMWRAARSGLSGPLMESTGRVGHAGEVVQALVARLRPRLEDTGDWAELTELCRALLARGDSASRQRARFAERGRVRAIVRAVHDETRRASGPVPDRPALTADYPDTPEDEAVAPSGVPYPAYRPVFEVLDKLGTEELIARAGDALDAAGRAGFTFGVDGTQRAMPVDLIPRIVPAHEWSVLAAGLTQRARAIELFLRDVYGAQRAVSDGVVDPADLTNCPGWFPDASRLPGGVVRAAVIGFDLVRDSVGGWRVLEDNARVPSGVGYAIGMRRISAAALPELAERANLREPGSVLPLIAGTLRAVAFGDGPAGGDGPVVALLSDGADNSAWFEHRMIAEEAGLLLVGPDDLELTDTAVRAAGRRVDVLYLRLGVELPDLRSSSGDPVGGRVFLLATRGFVVLANAPGAGVADDKSMYCLVPDLITYYLGERPLLQPVPTYRCGNPAEIDAVLDRLPELVTKPVDGYGGGGVLIGPHATSAEIEARRAEIRAAPARWIGQEVVALSTHPTVTSNGLEPRHVDLRAFVYQRGIGAHDATLADLALTRVASRGSMVVNSSRGGGAKDTWIAAEPEWADSD